MPIPPLAEQQHIVAEVERRLSLTGGVEAVVYAGLKRSARLRQAILKRAFEGKLVGRDSGAERVEARAEAVRVEAESMQAEISPAEEHGQEEAAKKPGGFGGRQLRLFEG